MHFSLFYSGRDVTLFWMQTNCCIITRMKRKKDQSRIPLSWIIANVLRQIWIMKGSRLYSVSSFPREFTILWLTHNWRWKIGLTSLSKFVVLKEQMSVILKVNFKKHCTASYLSHLSKYVSRHLLCVCCSFMFCGQDCHLKMSEAVTVV